MNEEDEQYNSRLIDEIMRMANYKDSYSHHGLMSHKEILEEMMYGNSLHEERELHRYDDDDHYAMRDARQRLERVRQEQERQERERNERIRAQSEQERLERERAIQQRNDEYFLNQYEDLNPGYRYGSIQERLRAQEASRAHNASFYDDYEDDVYDFHAPGADYEDDSLFEYTVALGEAEEEISVTVTKPADTPAYQYPAADLAPGVNTNFSTPDDRNRKC
jgi:hypothetical protein